MPFLVFLLECAAVARLTGTAFSALSVTANLLIAPRLGGLTPARRADVTFALAILPAIACLVVIAGAAAPSIMAMLGIATDHCATHDHHPHLCILHPSALRPWVAAVGASSLVVFLYRLLSLTRGVLLTASRLRHLEALGTRSEADFPVIAVPGRPHLCHATGLFRRRVFVSSEFSTVLSPSEMRAALAHEVAHLRRHDPAVLVLLAFASLFAVPAAMRFLSSRHGEAVEEACDAEAALVVADPTQVALALVKVAQRRQLRIGSLAAVPAFGEIALEQRVRRLLSDSVPAVSRSLALAIGAVGAFAGVCAIWLHAPDVHHAVETAFNHIFMILT